MAAHRQFPLFVALWLAALLALSCLVAGSESLGALVGKLHLSAIIPAAAPPLGMTARVLLAALCGALGATVGLVIGLRLQARARGGAIVVPQSAPVDHDDDDHAEDRIVVEPARPDAPRVRSRDAHPDAPPRRPLVVTEDVLPFAATSRFVAPEPAIIEPEARPAIDLAEDLPPFLAEAHRAGQPETPEPAAEPVASEPPVIVPPLPLASLAASDPRQPIAEAPIQSLGLVQLIERLALAIAVRQALRAEREAAPATQEIDPRAPLHRFDPLTMDHAGPLLRAKPLRQATAEDEAPEPADGVPEFAGSDDPIDDDPRYASLAAMAMPRPDLVHAAAPEPAPAEPGHETAPVVRLHPVVQRGSAEPQSAETGGDNDPDRALRDALATLRRISGQR